MSFTDLPEVETRPEEGVRTRDSRMKDYYRSMNQWCDAAMDEGQAAQENIQELRDIQGALDYMVGFQWKEAMPSYRAKPVSNEFFQMFWESIGLLTDMRPMFDITDLQADRKFSQPEKILNRMARGWTGTNQFQRKMSFATMWGMLTSAPAKLWWDPFSRGYSTDPEDADISFEALAPSSFLRLGSNSYNLQDDECVIYRRVRTLDWIKRGFPQMGKQVQAEGGKSRYTIDVQAPVGVTPQLFPPLSPGMKRLMGMNEKATYESIFPSAEVQEFWRNNDQINETRENVWVGPEHAAWGYWVKPGKKLYPRGQLIIRSNRVILMDIPNPYFHRRKPFAQLGLLGVPWQQYALSVVSPWMKQQDILNQMMAGVLQMIKKAVNPALMAPSSTINPVSLKAIDASKPGLKISLKANSSQMPVWQQPPNLPPYVLQTYGMILQSMKQSSGASAMGDAMSKKQVPAGDSLDKIQAAKNTPIRLMGRSCESFMDDIGQMWVGCALQFYDAARRAETLGLSGLTKEDFDDKPGSMLPDGTASESYVRRFHFRTRPGTFLGVQKQERIQVSFALRKNHDLSRKKLYEELDWNINLEENDAELMEEAKQMAAAQAAAGGGKAPGKKK